MQIIHEISIDFQRIGIRPRIHVKENDLATRFVHVAFYNDGIPYAVTTSTTTALMCYAKPDGTSGVYDHIGEGEEEHQAYHFDSVGKGVTIELAPSMMIGFGLLCCEVRLVQDGDILGTFTFDVDVERSVTTGTKADDYFSYRALDALYAAIDTAKEDAEEALAASMKDISAEYEEAHTSRPTLTPAEYMMEQDDGTYRISTSSGSDVFIGRSVAVDGNHYLELSEFYGGEEYLRSIYVDGSVKTTIHITEQDGATTIEPHSLVERVNVAVSDSASAVRTNARQDRQLSNIAAAIGGIVENVSEPITSRTTILRGGILPYGTIDKISETYVSAITVGHNIFDYQTATIYNAYIRETNPRWITSADSRTVKIPVTVGKRYRVSIVEQAGAIFRSGLTDGDEPSNTGVTITDLISSDAEHVYTATRRNLIVQVSTSAVDHDLANLCVTEIDEESNIDIPNLIKNNQAYIAGNAVVDFDARTMTADGTTVDISSAVYEDGFWLPNLADNAVVRFEPVDGEITSVDISYQSRIGG